MNKNAIPMAAWAQERSINTVRICGEVAGFNVDIGGSQKNIGNQSRTKKKLEVM